MLLRLKVIDTLFDNRILYLEAPETVINNHAQRYEFRQFKILLDIYCIKRTDALYL